MREERLVRLLLGHKEAEIVWYGSRSYVDQSYADRIYQNMFQLVDAKCMDDNMEAAGRSGGCDFYGDSAGTVCFA